jgi:hypothetical protein
VIVLLIAIGVIIWPSVLGETLIGWLMALIFGLFGINLIAAGASSKSG